MQQNIFAMQLQTVNVIRNHVVGTMEEAILN